MLERPKKRPPRLLFYLIALAWITPLAQAEPTVCPKAVVFVADGAGNFQACSRTLSEVCSHDHLPIDVYAYEWSHGYGLVLLDQLGYRYAREEGKKLAGVMLDYHRAHPEQPVFLIGHSAGSTVVLSAMEALPCGLIQRAFLLSPSVCTDYNIRPALCQVNDGLHVYYSQHDWWYLGLATHIIGTQDRAWFHPASGRVGFRWQCSSPDDAGLEGKLLQRPWMPEDAEDGNHGGHFGSYQPNFLRRHVLPWIRP